MSRPYDDICRRLHPQGDRTRRMQAVVDALWKVLADTGVSWIGFYLPQGEDSLVLGPRRDKPACSPIGLQGVCGRAFVSGKPIVVRDVAELGDDYIACDPRDRSEIVVPLRGQNGACWAVLDLDSHEVGAFGDDDAVALTKVLKTAGLTQ